MNQLVIWRNEESYSSAPQPYDRLWSARHWDVDQLRALATPATELEIAKHLALLLKAYPNAKAADGEVFGAMLIDDVAATRPSIGDIQEACRYLRRTSKFLPTIAEVLEAVATARESRLTLTRSIAPPVEARRTARIAHAKVTEPVSESNPLPL
jgi:hypothetical protein